MNIGIANIGLFSVFFDVVYEDTETVELIFTKDECKVSILDKGHTCFYDATYDKDFFDLYDVDDVTAISLFITDLFKILKTAGKDDYLLLSSDDDVYVTAKFNNKNSSRVFELVQADYAGSTPKFPEMDFGCAVELPIEYLVQSLKDLDILRTPNIRFKGDNNTLTLTSADPSVNYSNTINIDDVQGEGCASYDKGFVSKITKFKKISDNVNLEFGDDIPVKWRVSNNDMAVTGLIAPKLGE